MGPAAVDQILSTLVQVVAVSLLVTLAWAIFGRRHWSLSAYLGLKPAPGYVLLLATAAGILPVLIILLPPMRELASGPSTVAGTAARQIGMPGLIPILLLLAIFKTAFAEELLFRGLIAKRLIAWLGFGWGNLLQAVVFGSTHLPFLISHPLAGVAAFLNVSLFGWVAGWLNERFANGSILPGWVAHATGNIISYLFIAVNVS